MGGLERLEPLRKVGAYGYNSVPRYCPTARVTIPKGLGIVEEFKYLQRHTQKRIKATCPGPVTLTIHIRIKEDKSYSDRNELYWQFVPVINAGLRALAAGTRLVREELTGCKVAAT